MKRNMYTPRTPRMAKILSFVLIFVLAISITSVEALAATYETEIELKTTSIVLVDRSGSTKDGSEVDAILASMQISEDVPVGYFDSHKVTLDNKYNIGGNSSICEAIDDAVKNDYTHITIITDGQQWPQDYSALGIYSNVDIRFMLTDTEPEAAEKLLLYALENHCIIL